MGEQLRYNLALMTAETMYLLLEVEYKEGQRDVNTLMRRLKDLSAYSLTHAEILDQREGVEMLAIAMFFGATSDSRHRQNQERLKLLSAETAAYQGHSENIERQIAARKRAESQPAKSSNEPQQPRLL